jgi:DNA modification methylase
MALWSNPGETILTPFMGVGSEVFGAVRAGRRAIGIELKPSYFRQAKANIPDALVPEAQQSLFDLNTEDIADEDAEAL